MSENLTTYVEIDSGTFIDVIPSKITVTGLTGSDDGRIYKTGRNFDGDFTHQLDCNITDSAGTWGAVWSVSNAVDRWRDFFLGNTDGLWVVFGNGSTTRLGEAYLGSTTEDLGVFTQGVDYWLTIVRDESVGANGQLQCFIYTDSIRTVLHDTLTIALSAKVDFTIDYAYNADNSPTASNWDGEVRNLDLGLLAVASRRRRMLLRSN